MCSYDYDQDTGYTDYVECRECRDANNKLYNVEQALAELVKQLYNNDKLDVGLLDDAIGSICDTIGIQSPHNMPKVRRHGSDLFEFAAAINQ